MEHYKVTLTEQERCDLESLINKGKSAAKKLSNARVLLAVDRGGFNHNPENSPKKYFFVQDVVEYDLGMN